VTSVIDAAHQRINPRKGISPWWEDSVKKSANPWLHLIAALAFMAVMAAFVAFDARIDGLRSTLLHRSLVLIVSVGYVIDALVFAMKRPGVGAHRSPPPSTLGLLVTSVGLCIPPVAALALGEWRDVDWMYAVCAVALLGFLAWDLRRRPEPAS
jgi:hypothetical protein